MQASIENPSREECCARNIIWALETMRISSLLKIYHPSDEEMEKCGIVFMAIGDNDEVDSEPYVDDGLYWIGEESFPSMKGAFDHLFVLYREFLAELKNNKKKIKHLRRDVEYEQDQNEEIKIKLLESRNLMDSYDTTRFDSMEIEFGEAKKIIASLELENSKLEEHKLESVLLVNFS